MGREGGRELEMFGWGIREQAVEIPSDRIGGLGNVGTGAPSSQKSLEHPCKPHPES